MDASLFFKENISQLRINSSGQGFGLCPLHEDKNPSFSCNLNEGVWKCHGCEKSGNILQLAKLLGVNVFTQEFSSPLKEIARYTYEDENKNTLFQVRRYHPKTFRQFSLNTDGAWISGLNGISPVLYKLPEILNSSFVYVVEGEKDVETLWNLGLPATCNPMGAGKWKKEYSKYLKDKSITVIPDQDEVGIKHAEDVTHKLFGIVKEIKIISLPRGKDVSEWKELGGTLEELKEITQKARCVTNLSFSSFQERWPEIIPLNLQKTPKSISLTSLPSNLANIIHHISQVVQVPTELPLSVAISVLSAAIGKRASVQLPTHREVSSLYTCCILEPGSRKSETFKLLLIPILEAEEQMINDWRKQWKQWRAEGDLAEEQIRDCRHRAKKIKNSFDKENLITQMTEAQGILEKEPIKPQLWTEDTTSESLRKLVVENGSIGVFSAEGGSVLESFGRYSGNRGADIGIWLAGHAGDPGKVTRMRGDSSSSKEQLISISLTAQKQVLQSIGKDKMLRGRGLIDRFLWFIPADPRGTRSYDHTFSLSSSILNEWSAIIKNILSLPTFEKSPTISLTPPAQFLWKEFAKEVELRQVAGGDLRSMSGWASKIAGQVSRIALAFHFSEKKSIHEMISEQILSSSIELGHSLIEHAKAAFSLIGEDAELTKARIVAEHIQKSGLEEIKIRYVQQMGWAGCSNSDEIHRILKRLESHGILQEHNSEKIKQSGRPSSSFFLINPRLKEFPLTERTSFQSHFVGSVGFVGGGQSNNSNSEEGSVTNEF